MVDLGGLPGGVPYSGSLSSAMAINANGQIVGQSYRADSTYDPVMWSYNGSAWTITDLNPTHSVVHGQSSAYGVNQYGDAVGSGFAEGGISPTTRAILFKHDGTVVLVPRLDNLAASDAARAINSFGTVVGNAGVVGVGNVAFVYDSTAGVTQNLNTLVAPDGSGTGWLLQWAYGIDDVGHIAGFGTIGGVTRGYLLTPLLPGDANEDGRVDINDLSRVLTNYDKTEKTWADGDFNNDGKVDINDLSVVLTNYDHSLGSSSGGMTAVPEPSTIVLIGLALAGMLAFARWRMA
jgi:uncharacterized membrane protein